MIEKTAMIAIIGRPNVGKSTLTNKLVGEKITIVSPKPQTTRNKIYAVVNRGDTQIVLIDTPGFHKARTRLGEYMVKVINETVTDIDAAVLMVEPKANIGTQEEKLIERIEAEGVPAILAINKVDTVKKEELLAVIAAYNERHEFDAVVPISAKTGLNINALLDEMEKFAIEGPELFPEDMITDQPERQIVAEIVREKLLLCLDDEIPHGTAVEVTRFHERGDGMVDLDVTIYCEKESHKGMIIGRRGTMLKKVGEEARRDIEEMLGCKVFLQTWVRVKENWRDNLTQLKNFGFGGDESF